MFFILSSLGLAFVLTPDQESDARRRISAKVGRQEPGKRDLSAHQFWKARCSWRFLFAGSFCHDAQLFHGFSVDVHWSCKLWLQMLVCLRSPGFH